MGGAGGRSLSDGVAVVGDGKLPVPARQTATGTIVAGVPVAGCAAGAVLYARVSWLDQLADLDRQVAALTVWAAARGVVVAGVVREVGSGVDGKRPKLRRVLSDPSATVIVAGRRGRLARLGVEYVDAAVAVQGGGVLVAGAGERADDLVRDMAGVLTSMYGRRGARNRALRAVTAAKNAGADAAAAV